MIPHAGQPSIVPYLLTAFFEMCSRSIPPLNVLSCLSVRFRRLNFIIKFLVTCNFLQKCYEVTRLFKVNLSDLVVHVQLQAIYGPRFLRIEPVDQILYCLRSAHDVSPVFGSGVGQGDGVFHNLTLWELSRWEEVFHSYRRWVCLNCSCTFFLFGLFLLVCS